MNLEVTKKAGQGTVVRPISDSLDANNVAGFRQAMDPILNETDSLVLDLQDVHIIDSSGLGGILACFRRLSKKGGTLKLRGVRKSVRPLFELARLDHIVDIH